MKTEAPKGITTYLFGKSCNTHGGSAFRDWYMLMKYKGVFVGFHNHDWCIMYSSDPSAEWHRGMNAPCSHGDPRPQSKTAKLVGLHELPEAARPLANKWVEEAVEIAKQRCAEVKLKEDRDAQAAKEARRIAHQREVHNPWLAAVEEDK